MKRRVELNKDEFVHFGNLPHAYSYFNINPSIRTFYNIYDSNLSTSTIENILFIH